MIETLWNNPGRKKTHVQCAGKGGNWGLQPIFKDFSGPFCKLLQVSSLSAAVQNYRVLLVGSWQRGAGDGFTFLLTFIFT